MFWSVDFEVRGHGYRLGLVRLGTDELLGRGLQPELADLRVSRTAGRLAANADLGEAYLENITGVFDAHGHPADVVRLEVGTEVALSQDGELRARVVRLQHEIPSIAAQRIGEAPVLLHGPAWRIDVSEACWLRPTMALAATDFGLVREDGGWVAVVGGQRERVEVGKDIAFGAERIWFLRPPRADHTLQTVVSGARSVQFERNRGEQWIRVHTRTDTVELAGAPYFALSALLDTPEFEASAKIAQRAQRGWTLSNFNTAVYQVRVQLRGIVDIDTWHKVSGAQRRFDLGKTARLVDLGEDVQRCPTCGQAVRSP